MNKVIFVRSKNLYRYCVNRDKKYFKNKIDALCYKFCMDLKQKTFWNICRIE